VFWCGKPHQDRSMLAESTLKIGVFASRARRDVVGFLEALAKADQVRGSGGSLPVRSEPVPRRE
jgi:hypothetical protein